MDPRDHLPLKDLAFRSTSHPAPARTLDRMLVDGLIAEHDAPQAKPPKPTRGAVPTRFFQLTPLGRAVTRAETDRLAALVARSRAGRLLKVRR